MTSAGTKSKWSADGVDTLDRATDSPYELGEIPLRATSYVFGDATAETSLVMLAVDADLRAFAFGRKDGHLIDVADLRMLTTELGTGMTERYERQVEMSFPATARFGSESWHTLAQEFRLMPGRYQARIAVRDANSGRIGAVTHDFEVGPLTGLRVTTPILTDSIEAPSSGTAGAAEAGARRAAELSCRRHGLLPVQRPRRGQGRRRRSQGHRVARASRPGRRRRQADGAATDRPGADGGLSRLAGLNLTGLAAGDYELLLTVRDDVAGQAVERREPFAILPPEPLTGSAAREP